MKNKGRSQNPIDNTKKFSMHLNKNCNLNNPEEAEAFIQTKPQGTATKRNHISDYIINIYCKFINQLFILTKYCVSK